MSNLFLKSGANFSECRLYRYALWRIWDESLPTVMWIGLNPSTADETVDDPTIRRCKAFSADWGYGGMYMLNLFAFRATDPRVMRTQEFPIGQENYRFLQEYHDKADLTVAAWGIHGKFLDQDIAVAKMLTEESTGLVCLGTTKDGHPKHPLYVAGSTQRVRYRVRGV